MTRTENLLEEAELLLAKHKQDMEDNPDSFAHRLAYKSLLNHVQYLRIQVMRAEMTQAEKALHDAIEEFDKAVIRYAENQGNLEFRAIYEFYQELIEHLKKRLREEEEIRRVVGEMLDE